MTREPIGHAVGQASSPAHPKACCSLSWLGSLLLHLAIAFSMYDRPIGYIDTNALKTTSGPMIVKRTKYDRILPANGSNGSEPEQGPSQQQVAAALLQNEIETPPVPQTPDPDLGLRAMKDERLAQPVEELADEPAAFDLPDDVLASMQGEAPRELDQSAGTGTGEGEGGGGFGGEGDGDGQGGGGGAGAAQRLLAQAGFAGPGGGGAGNAMPKPGSDRFKDTAPTDHRLIDAPLQSPQIDFSRIALDQTTKLDVPEHLDQDFGYKITRYEPPDGRGYFRVDITARKSLSKLETMPKDVVFLVDTSSSVPQEWVTQAIRGVQQSLSALNEGDRFNIILFNEHPAFFSTKRIQPATRENIEKARQWVTHAQSQGWTDVNAALSQLLVRDLDVERVYDIVLISDGKPTRGVMDTRSLLNVITRDNNMVASIYCVGIGNDQNHELLEFLAYRNKGFCRFVPDVRKTATTIRDLMSQLRYPLIKNVSLTWAGAEMNEVYPGYLRNIHQGETLSVYGRYVAADAFTMRITGQNGKKAVDFTFSRDLRNAPKGDKQIAQSWAFWKLHHLYSRIMREGETETLRARIDALRRQYDLKTLY